jgi:acyl-CoA ligase (AMP-forming) (exosortase A-associated)
LPARIAALLTGIRVTTLLHVLPALRAAVEPGARALTLRSAHLSYGELAGGISAFAGALVGAGLGPHERVGIFLPKTFETVIAMFGAAHAGCVFVPINPLLKAPQVEHILNDCAVRVLVTSADRVTALQAVLPHCPQLQLVVLTGPQPPEPILPATLAQVPWEAFITSGPDHRPHRVIDTDMAAILYTSGSTGKPKGVVLSHRNMVTGAHSVAEYLENIAEDRLLAVLPFSFDYGFSQLSTAFHVGASVVLMDHLFARDVVNAVARERITGLAAVPPLWLQLADLAWPESVGEHLRYFTNSGGAMPRATLDKLRAALPRTRPFLMYGLTEAFRSTYLPPAEVDRRPDSMGKAIPNAEILVVRPDGTPCAADEPGELVHRGSLVALGYWNDPVKTAERFKPVPNQDPALVLTEMAVWSGDTVRRDAEGFLYFVGRRDEMIKTSGYRVSPTEVEEAIYATGLVGDVVAVGVPHPALGQAIVIVASPPARGTSDSARLLEECKRQLPNFMVPHAIEWRDSLPRNPNGKFDRPALASEMKTLHGSTP